MSFCLVADVSCDLPEKYNQHPNLRLLPTHVFIGKEHFLDTRDPEKTAHFYLKNLASPMAVEGRSEPLKADEMLDAFNQNLALNFDQVLGVFVAATRSAIYIRAKEALARARIHAYSARAKAGIFTPMQADCLDSQAFFAGYGVQVLDLLEQISQGMSLMDIIARQQKLVRNTYAYMVPGDVSYILRRAAFKGEKSVSALAGFAAKTFSITPILRGHMGQTAAVGRKLGIKKARMGILQMAQRAMEQRLLLSDHICLSYSGDVSEISQMDSYKRLQDFAHKKRIQVHLTQMSMTGSVNVGPDALCLGMLASDHEVLGLL
jgi:fatty acid-binding protein DegV